MTLTGSLQVMTQHYYDLLLQNKDALGLKAIYYGDQDNIPVTPVAAVEPNNKTRTYRRIGRGTDVAFTIFVIVYHSSIRDPQSNRSDADKLAEDIEAVIHADETAGGLFVTSLVTSMESGYATKGSSIMRASRLTVEGNSQERLPLNT